MKYRFDIKIQLIYGLAGFILSFLIIYFFVGKFDWLASTIIGLFEFALSGFYTQMKKKKSSKKKK